MRRVIFRTWLGLLAFALTPLPSLAQPTPVGGEFRVNTETALKQDNPQVASDGEGNFVVVWTDGDFTNPGLDGSSLGVVGQRYDSSGNPIGSAFVVNTDTLGEQFEPAVAMDEDGNFAVVWTDNNTFGGTNDGDRAGIEGQLFDSGGNPVGSQFQVNALTTDQQTRATVDMDGDGNFVVSWGTFRNSGADLFLRRFSSDGTPLGTEFQVNTYTNGRQYRQDVGFDANGDFIVAWRSEIDDDNDDYDIIVRRYDSSGNPLSGEITANTYTTEEQRDPAIAVADGGEFVVVWASEDVDGDNDGIAGQRFDSAGAPVGNEFIINTYTTSSQTNPTVAMDGSGNFTVVWASFRQDGEGRGVFGQQFDTSANPVGGEFMVNTFTAGDQGYSFRGPDLAMDDDGNFAAVWQDSGGFAPGGSAPGQDGDASGVYAQLYEGAGGDDPDLRGHWPLDEGSGAVAGNNQSSGLDGALENGTAWTPGQQNSGSFFDGVDDLIRISDPGDSSIDVTGALTIALWVRPDAIDGSTNVLVSKDNAYELEFGKLGAATWDLRLDNQVAGTAPTSLEQGVWQHLAVTWDGTDVTFYYNGLVDGSATFNGMLTPNNEDLAFGARPVPFGNGTVFPFTGALDEIYLFSRVLDDTEIAQLVLDSLTDIAPPVRSNLAPADNPPLGTTTVDLTLDTDENASCRYDTTADTAFDDMANDFTVTGGTAHSSTVAVADGQIFTFYVRCRDGLGNTDGDDAEIRFGVGNSDLALGLVSSWDLNEGSGCLTGDSTSGLDGVLGPNCPANAPTWSVGHDGGSALTFDNQDDSVTVANAPDLATPAGITMSAWIRHPGNTGFRSIIDMRDGNTDGYDLYVQPGSKGFMRVNTQTLTGQTVIADGTWHHVVGTYDGNEIRIYVDGQLDASSVVGALTLNVGADLQIGRHFKVLNNTLGGELSQVRIWKRGLSTLEVLDLYLLTQ